MASLPSNDRLLELLADRACYGLGELEAQELAVELESHAGVGEDEFEAAAVALSLAFVAAAPLPGVSPSLRASLARAAGSIDAPVVPRSAPRLALDPADATDVAVKQLRREGAVPTVAWLGWLAAAAALLFAVVVRDPGSAQSPGRGLANLVASAADVVEAPWLGLAALGFADAPHPLDTGIAGRVVWSDERNEGYMQIEGLSANDPAKFQYQLWIFDATRPVDQLPQFASEAIPLLSQRPVDGGVFDFVPGPDGKAIISIDPKLRVGKGAIFAITVEPPGGVVVSDRDIVFAAVRG